MPRTVSSPADLLAALRTLDPTSPRLTWYGPHSERVELSGRVLENWVAKTANFLTDELDAEPGTVVGLDLPPHWRTLCWAMAAFATGATVRLADMAGADIVATTSPAEADGGAAVVAVALPALAMRWTGELPAGAVDYATEARAHADVFTAFSEPAASDTAVSGAGDAADVEYGHLFDGYAAQVAPGARILLHAADGVDAVLRQALGCWAAGGSVVLVHPDVAVSEHLVSMEKITAA